MTNHTQRQITSLFRFENFYYKRRSGKSVVIILDEIRVCDSKDTCSRNTPSQIPAAMAEPTSIKTSSLRLLILAPSSPDSISIPPFRNLLEAITGSKPSDEITSFAGYTSHPPLSLRTKYYSAEVSIWCDELPLEPPSGARESKPRDQDVGRSENGPDLDGSTLSHESRSKDPQSSTSTLSHWKEQMLSDAAAEVRAVIGGIILILPISAASSSSSIPSPYVDLVETVHALREAVEDESYGRDIASVVVLQGTSSTVKVEKVDKAIEELEELCLAERGILGWDFVAWEGAARSNESGDWEESRNEYGEKRGIMRVVEVLEGVDWSASPNEDDEGEFDLEEFEDGDDEGEGMASSTMNMFSKYRFSGLDHELQREMMELKISMLEEDEESVEGASQTDRKRDVPENEDVQVEQLQGLMERVVAIREAGSEMSTTEREKFAKREIGRIMREMG